MTLLFNKEWAKRAVVLLRASSKQQTDREHDFDIPQQKSILLPFVELKSDDLKRASSLDFKDYEDAIQSAQANRIKANYIITRNIMDYNKSKVTAIKPSELIERI